MKQWKMILTMGLLSTVTGCPEVEFEGDDTASTGDTGTVDKDTQDTTDSSPDSGTDSSYAKSCEELDVDQCAQRQDCRVIDGRKVFEAEKCLMSSQPLGCMSVNLYCGDAETPAKNPDGECYWFPSTCVPDGWKSLFGTSECEVGDYRLCACEEYSAASCPESNGCTKIYGRRGVVEDQCLLDSEAVGCMSAEMGCGAVITFATNPAGDCYQFGGCIPAGWSEPDAASGCNYESFPGDKSCDPSSLACDELTVKQCAARDECGTIGGRRIDTDNQCLLDYENVGCMSADAGCDGEITLAKDPNSGACYWFSSGCIPRGWSPEYNDPTCNAPGDIAACN